MRSRAAAGLRRSVLTAALGAAVAACARSTAVVPAPAAADDTVVRTWATLLWMTDARRLDTAVIGDALASRQPALRAAAALAIGQVRGNAMAANLRPLLASADTGVAANAAYALGLLRDTASVPALGDALDGDTIVAAEAAWALGQIGESARASIGGGLAAHRAPTVHAALLVAASKLRPVPLELVVPHLVASDPVVTRAAAYAIARPRVPAGVRVLLELAVSGDGETREQVARGLSRSAAGDSLGTAALAVLVMLANDSSAHVRISALRSLATYGAPARDAVVAATRDVDANVRIAAAQSIGASLGASGSAWVPLWAADSGFAYRRTLVTSAVGAGAILAAIDPGNPDNWQRHPDWRYRAAAAEAGGSATQIAGVRALSLPLTIDPDPRVRVAAWSAFAPHVDVAGADQHLWLRATLLGALDDDDPFVRAVGLAALATQARAAELPAVLASYRRALADTANDARIAAARYFAAAWRRDSASFSDSLRAALASIPVPDDPLVRAAAAGADPLAAWDHAAGTGRPVAWYEERVRALIVPALGGRTPLAEIVTERGTIILELFALDAPLTVDNFVMLARSRFYDGVRFHRVVPGFVAQDGDPRGDGNGGPPRAIRDELNRRRYERGTVGMALSGPDTGGSQYFITLSPQPHLDGGYTVFGRVVRGMDVVDVLVQGDRIERIVIR
ncbi:MAG: peptidylprolyl isomerase [Gemmatimonadota bacterium]|nr:peptidylprolyl isomerase [Gemmatimonadota bacterium]